MKAYLSTASAVAALLLATGGAATGDQPRAGSACAGQIHPNPGFERGATGWTAGPRVVVLGDAARPAHTGRAYATFAGLDVTRTDLLRTTVTIPADCALTIALWSRATTTETARGDHLNIGLAVTGTPPKTMASLAYDHPAEWTRRSYSISPAATERTATISFAASETAGNGVTAFDVDDVTFVLG